MFPTLSTIAVCNLLVSMLVTQRKPKTLHPDQLLNLALRALGGRAHSTGELRDKLRKRAAAPEDVDAVLAKLKQAGYLDDQRFAEHYAAARLENQRRVAGKLAEQVTERAYQDTNEPELIQAFLKRKYRGKQLRIFFADEKNLAAAYRRLRYAGFSSGASIKVLKQYANQAEALDGIEAEESEPES